ncbi:MAG: hypothetical protein EKK60_04245 [Gordonia sp. (in: high G+C Gram-positive bacteria)]|nr:MAG: hypothetical protein EKK60_04245 [Gordonia sp. (in: high G+C Gram-positive bacteria)]
MAGMTQPQDPQDPFRSSTRRFDPEHPTSAYDPADIPATQQYPGTQQYQGTQPYPGNQYPGTQYGTAQYGTEQYGQSYGGGGGSDNGKRTKILIGSIVAALVAILLVAFLISVTGGHDDEGPGPGTSQTTATSDTTSSETSETTSETTSPTEQTQTTAPSAPGQVVYRLVGDGSLIVVRYRTSNGIMTAATVRSPWSVSAFTDNGTASLDAMVVSGSVTCQIVVAGTVVAEGTSSGGPLSCSAEVE